MHTRKPWLAVVVLVGLALVVLVWLLLEVPSEAEDRPAMAGRDHASSSPPVESVTPVPRAAESSVAVASQPAKEEARTPGTRRISGRVVRASDGTALPDADIGVSTANETDATASPADSTKMPGETVQHLGRTAGHPETRTKAPDGSFELLDVPTDARELRVVLKRGWPRQPLLVDLPPGADDVTDLTITFDSGFIVRGTVRDLRGAPVFGAAVDAGTLKSAFADAQGEYVLKDVAPWPGVRAIECTATAVNFEEQSQPLAVPGAPSDVVTADFTLAGVGALEGTLTDTSGQALPDVDVWTLARRLDTLGRTLLTMRHAVSDEAGHYRVERLSEGPTDVWFTSLFLGNHREAFSIWGFERTVDADAVEEAYTGEWKPDLKEKLRIFGRGWEWPRRGLATRCLRDFAIEPGETTRLDQVLDGGTRLEGRVTDAEGKPVRGAFVYTLVRPPHPERREDPADFLALPIYDTAHDYDYESSFEMSHHGERWMLEASAHTDEQGRYALLHLSPGWKLLKASPPFGPQRPMCLGTSRPIEVPDPADLLDVDLVLPALDAGPVMVGRVQDPGGEPIDAARALLKAIHDAPGAPAELVMFQSYRSAEDARGYAANDGRLHVVNAAPGRYTMELAAPGFITLHDTLTIPGPERVWVLQPSLDLHVTVEDAMTHARVVHFELIARNPDELDRWRAGDAGLGRLRVERNADVPCDVTVTADGYLKQTFRDVLPSSTSHDHPLSIRLQPQF